MTQGQIVGYARVSTTDQDTGLQESALADAGCNKIFAERVSGTSTKERTQLAQALEYVREGDTFVVTRIDRLARSLKDLTHIIDQLDRKGVSFRCLDQPIDTSGPTGRLTLGILGAVAQFETEIRRERQAEGIQAAKVKGKYQGRKPLDPAKIKAVKDAVSSGVSVARACRDHGISRQAYYSYR